MAQNSSDTPQFDLNSCGIKETPIHQKIAIANERETRNVTDAMLPQILPTVYVFFIARAFPVAFF